MKQMKNFKFAIVAALTLAALLSSCAKGDDAYLFPSPNALVTIKTAESGETYFQLDEKTTLEPVNWTNPYKREVRALLSYSEEAGDGGLFSKKVKVAWIDSVRTKDAVVYDEEFKKGNSVALSIYPDWITCCEDGYLTIHFAAWFGQDYAQSRVVHYIDLAVDPETHDLYLRHDDNGDNAGTKFPGEGVVAFRLDKLMKDVKDGQEVTLHWKNYEGDVTSKVKYYSRFPLTK